MADQNTDERTSRTTARELQGGQDLMIEVDGKMIPNYDATIMTFEEGDIVTGTVVRVDKDEVLVDIGYKSEGVVPANELSIRKSVDPAEEVSVGDVIDALVLTKEDADGRLILSRKRARFERAWQRIEKAAEEGTPVSGTVIEVVKGGLILDLGVRGFLPASLVDIRRVADLDEFLGQTLECRVIELNRFRNNVVLSRRAVLEEERRGAREQILDRMNVGDLVSGTISNIVDFGAFVDLDGIDGLIHISELSWSHVNHPSEVLTIGQKVTVRVLDIDRDRQRISLGLKQTQKDPWQEVFENRQVNEIVHGRVTKLVSFGAFVEIEEGVEGLIHISELAQHHVEDPRRSCVRARRSTSRSSRSTPSVAACRSASSASSPSTGSMRMPWARMAKRKSTKKAKPIWSRHLPLRSRPRRPKRLRRPRRPSRLRRSRRPRRRWLPRPSRRRPKRPRLRPSRPRRSRTLRQPMRLRQPRRPTRKRRKPRSLLTYN